MSEYNYVLLRTILHTNRKLLTLLSSNVLENLIYGAKYHNAQLIPILHPDNDIEQHYKDQMLDEYVIWRYGCHIVPSILVIRYTSILKDIIFDGVNEYDRELSLMSKVDKHILDSWTNCPYGLQEKIVIYDDDDEYTDTEEDSVINTHTRLNDHMFAQKYPIVSWITAYMYGGRALDAVIWNANDIRILYGLEHQFFSIYRLNGNYPWPAAVFARRETIFYYIYEYIGHLYVWNNILTIALMLNNNLIAGMAIKHGAYQTYDEGLNLCPDSTYEYFKVYKYKKFIENVNDIIETVIRNNDTELIDLMIKHRFHIDAFTRIANDKHAINILERLMHIEPN